MSAAVNELGRWLALSALIFLGMWAADFNGIRTHGQCCECAEGSDPE